MYGIFEESFIQAHVGIILSYHIFQDAGTRSIRQQIYSQVIIYHAFSPHPCFKNLQVMEFRVFNISKMTQELKGRVALTPGSRLTWIGFSDEGSLSSYDSEVCFLAFLLIHLLLHWCSLHTTRITTKKVSCRVC